MQIAVVCDELVVAGGLIRFERFGKVARELGHEVSFVQFGSRPSQRTLTINAMSFDDARRRDWDAVMVPGAGFSADVVNRFAELRRPGFGIRVQHLLNSQARKEAFLAVNRSFLPQIVISNNRHWTLAELAEFDADVTCIVEGAVDVAHFAPPRDGTFGPVERPFTIGGLVNKNPAPLLQAAKSIDGVHLRLFGRETKHPPETMHMIAELETAGKMQRVGVLNEADLPAFYRSVDCVVHAETFAGWANLGAEALASGIPLICTPHGTLAFARHEETALVIGEPDAEAIVEAIIRLKNDPRLRQRLRSNGLKQIAAYDWLPYTNRMIGLLETQRAQNGSRQ